ncbi:MAG: hypothetical protein NTX03_07690 [Bacteroidetes bacterium]|nr:hypothetical protein [Bacteroidota bacterium]
MHPLINPITDEEIQCYLDFRAIEKEEKEWERTPRLVLEHYHLFKILNGEDNQNQLCDWFEFYDNRFGTKGLMDLPMYRLEVLHDYLDIWSTEIYYPTLSEEDQKTIRHLNRQQREYFREHPEEKKLWDEESDRLWEEREAKRVKYEHLSTYDTKLMKEIVALVEDHNNQMLCKYHKKWHEDNPTDDFELELSIGELNADGIEIEENDDWKVAVKTAAELNEERKINEALLEVIDEYKKARDAGEIFSMKYKGGHRTEISPSHRTIRERVLEARKFKGEPENFDFIKTENLFKK